MQSMPVRDLLYQILWSFSLVGTQTVLRLDYKLSQSRQPSSESDPVHADLHGLLFLWKFRTRERNGNLQRPVHRRNVQTK
mmetsp:Transcript_40769/g.41362  ORF Transcript_40769/g.41362 Transcript_40769/m.41362 type:complete len:80 (-) Transcript_40769:951-1190(-)